MHLDRSLYHIDRLSDNILLLLFLFIITFTLFITSFIILIIILINYNQIIIFVNYLLFYRASSLLFNFTIFLILYFIASLNFYNY